jgi:hypothetical protein
MLAWSVIGSPPGQLRVHSRRSAAAADASGPPRRPRGSATAREFGLGRSGGDGEGLRSAPGSAAPAVSFSAADTASISARASRASSAIRAPVPAALPIEVTRRSSQSGTRPRTIACMRAFSRKRPRIATAGLYSDRSARTAQLWFQITTEGTENTEQGNKKTPSRASLSDRTLKLVHANC